MYIHIIIKRCPLPKPTATDKKSPPTAQRRLWIRGAVAAAFTAAATGGGLAVWQATEPGSPYKHPRAKEAYHIPDRACTAALTSDAPLPAAPRGQGQPVMIVPGFMGGEMTMRSLSAKLSAHGYTTYGWGQGVNTGISEEVALGMATQLNEIAQKHPGQKIALVGFSLGGVYARELARQFPDKVSQVITLGAPFALTDKKGDLDPIMRRTFNTFTLPLSDEEEAKADTRKALPVPTTSIFGLQDRIVNWRASLNYRSGNTENIPVDAGHLSITRHDRTAEIILHRLAQPADNWQPLAPKLCAQSPLR
jgi:esterase/lipase